jgi:hypothetical protein
MGEQYSHTLIAVSREFVPAGLQIQSFLTTIISDGVIPENPTITLRILTGKFREYPHKNPFTGENIKIEIKDLQKLESLEKIPEMVEPLRDFEVAMESLGRPKMPPLEIKFNEPYHLCVTCRVYSKCRSTSDPHEEAPDYKSIIPYGKVCTQFQDVGTFANPHTLDSIVVPHAGCARFWIEFELGKFLCPEFATNSLELLNPHIVSNAEKIFGTKFVQGCCWG